ncbi:hypothetical protein [Bacillus sp. AFS040349]|uniref:hypothetical protein n=1 Tax=Bacillus sp. AFS040349 TaxID=2033502 RepID=UPI000BFCE71A|nr:hypothetical protein [Bacillus sp. AFS040349]PGT83295.1 hypothetical protein COD11_13245 [Bacillus sp. AFS040349]
MKNWLKSFLTPSLEEKLFILTKNKEKLINDINKGKLVFNDNERVIEFATLLTERLNEKFEENNELNPFEMKVLDEFYNGDFRKLSFVLLSTLEGNVVEDLIIFKLIKHGFHLLDGVGYINVDKNFNEPVIEVGIQIL